MSPLLVSANDAKLVRSEGRDLFPESPGPDTVCLVELDGGAARVVRTVEVSTSIVGPPQAVALSPDRRWIAVAAPTRYVAGQGLQFDHELQVIDLNAEKPQVTRIGLGAHPQGLAFTPDGSRLLVTTVTGELVTCSVIGDSVQVASRLRLSDGTLAGVAVVPDGSAAIIALRHEQGAVVVDLSSPEPVLLDDRIGTGVSPYVVSIADSGDVAVIGNVGWAGSATKKGRMVADVDSFTVVDLTSRPFRAVQHVTVASIPEGVAVSPDGRLAAALCMGGSNLPPGTPGHHPEGRLQVFSLATSPARLVADLPAGAAAQGVIFSSDGRTLVAQFFADRALAFYDVDGDTVHDSGRRLAMPGGPSSLGR